jgi:hypothetical protein
MTSLTYEPQMYHFIGFLSTSSRSASNGDGSRNESILEDLDARVRDSEDCENGAYDSDEYIAAMKELEAELS